MLAREEFLAAARECGWKVYRDLRQDLVGTVEVRRVVRSGGRQRTEYMRVRDDSMGRFVEVTWAPSLDGVDARSPVRDKRAWALSKIKATSTDQGGIDGFA
jgi:hypothetical protein